MLSINSQFDAGAIEVVSLNDPQNIQLKVRKDNASDFAQWFYFRVHGGKEQALTLSFINGSECAYPAGWENYQAVASYNRQDWFRVPTRYDGKTLSIDFTPACDTIWFAYFEPYSYERHLDLIAWANESEHVNVEHLGSTIDGRDMTLLKITDAYSSTPMSSRKKVWIQGRQHPGETMAEWFIEGLLERLLNNDDPVSRVLLDKCMFYVVPHMNPDGAVRGNLRTNAVGSNLNREWQTPTMERSPEVFLVREKMLATGIDLFLDAHGDEGLPYNFVAGCEGNPGYNDRIAQLEKAFRSAWHAVSPDFQDEYGYTKDTFGEGNLTLATNWVGQQFDCLAYTIEMPFKDNANLPDPDVGWNGERSKVFGASVLSAIYSVIDRVR